MLPNHSIAVIGDIHGCFHTLEKIYQQLNGIDGVYSVGDLIDRGRYSKNVVEFCISNSIRTVKGNHEDMLIKAVENSDKFMGFMFKDAEHYYYNGGRETQYSYIESRLFSNFKFFKEEMKSLGHYDFIKSLPLKYKINKVMISHAGIIRGGDENSILWNRDTPDILDELQIFGHTPFKEVVYKKNYYANIDTGCVYKNKLTAVIVDTEKGQITDTIQEEYDPRDVD